MRPQRVAVIGAGPVGLAAAAHLIEEGLNTIVLEAGNDVGSSVESWGHVRLFSPWRYNIDAAAARLLLPTGWTPPALDELPTGQQLVGEYLLPLSRVPELRGRIRLGARVTSISRTVGKVTHDRDETPFVIRVATVDGEEELHASSVIDASGTWLSPNPLGANGVSALGERALRQRLRYGIPDLLGAERARYAGRTTAVVGSGHSAANTILALAALKAQEPQTRIHWVVRGRVIRAFGGGTADELEARGRLGTDTQDAVTRGIVDVHDQFGIHQIRAAGDQLVLLSPPKSLGMLHNVVVATGQRPDLTLVQELRLDLDLALDSAKALGPLIDPNVHSCGTVRPHTFQHLTHPETGFFIAGAKSYGRAPTFLMATGYEQVRSIAAHLAGDDARAGRVSLVLPETGVCGSGSSGGCSTTESNALVGNATGVLIPAGVPASACGG